MQQTGGGGGVGWGEGDLHFGGTNNAFQTSQVESPSFPSQPPTVVCKMEALLEYVRVAYTFFCTFGADVYAQSALINKISASELSRKFIKSA